MIGVGLGVWRLGGGVSYAVSGFEPDLVLDFSQEFYRMNGGSAFSDLTFTRASTATYVDSTGTLQTASSGEARVGHHVHDGSDWVNKGLLLETDGATNLLLNSGTLSTQNVTVSAQAYTLHFTGTGTITLSGASTAGPLVGTGTGENNRVSLTFTPSAGTLTLTVSGTVSNAQLEAGLTPSSYIPTTGTTATRAAETLKIPAARMFTYTTALSFALKGTITYADEGDPQQAFFYRWWADTTKNIRQRLDTATGRTGQVDLLTENLTDSQTVTQSAIDVYAPGVNVPFSIAARVSTSSQNQATEGTADTEAALTAIADLSAADLELGFDFNGTIETFLGWATSIGDAGIEAATA